MVPSSWKIHERTTGLHAAFRHAVASQPASLHEAMSPEGKDRVAGAGRVMQAARRAHEASRRRGAVDRDGSDREGVQPEGGGPPGRWLPDPENAQRVFGKPRGGRRNPGRGPAAHGRNDARPPSYEAGSLSHGTTVSSEPPGDRARWPETTPREIANGGMCCGVARRVRRSRPPISGQS